MTPFELIGFTPAAGGVPADQAAEVLRHLRAHLRESGRSGRHALALTFFVNLEDDESYRACVRSVTGLVSEAFRSRPPPATVVAQPPEGNRDVVLEACLLTRGDRDFEFARPSTAEGLPYTVVTGPAGRQVHAAGITSSRAGVDPSAQAEAAFAKMEAILTAEGLTYGHVVRQWNYIEGVLDLRGELQRYQAFNDARTRAYGRSGFPAGYPAATGIGQAAGGTVLEFVALDPSPGVRVVPISNPNQIDAHRYSPDVLVGGPDTRPIEKTSPKFERAKLVAGGEDEIVLVSGTAAILGQESVATDDVRAQTLTTIENIGVLVDGERLTHLRAYVKRPEDFAVVRETCRAAYGGIPATFVKADICRDELLVELEGELVRRKTTGRRP